MIWVGGADLRIMAKEKPILAGPAASAVSGYGFLSLPTTEAHAIAQFGEALTDIGQGFARRINQAEEDKQSLEAEGKILENFAIFEGQLDLDPDYESYDQKFKTFLEAQDRNIVKNIRHRGARERSRLRLLDLGGRWAGRIQDRKWKAQAQAIYDQGMLAIEQGLQLGNMDHVDSGLALLTSNNQITSAGAERIRLKAQTTMSKRAQQHQAIVDKQQERAETDAYTDEAIRMATEGIVPIPSPGGTPMFLRKDADVEGAYKYIRDIKGISYTQRNEIIGRFERFLARAEVAAQQHDDEGLRHFNRRIFDSDLPPDIINEIRNFGFSDPKDEEQLCQAVTARVRAILEGDDIIDDEPTRKAFTDRARQLDPRTENVESFVAELRALDTLKENTKDNIEKVARAKYEKVHADVIARAVQQARDLARFIPDVEKEIDARMRLPKTHPLSIQSTEDINRVRAEFRDIGQLILDNARAAEEAIEQYGLSPDNASKTVGVKDKETDEIVGHYFRMQEEGTKRLRRERAKRYSREFTLDEQIEWLREQGVSEEELKTYRKIVPDRSDPVVRLEMWLGTQAAQSLPPDMLRDVRNGLTAIEQGRNRKMVIDAIVDKYKNRAKVQEFINTMLKPIAD